MINPNPFVPQGSLLEQQSQRRSRLKLAVSCVLVASIGGLTVMLLTQAGCQREKPVEESAQTPFGDTNFSGITPPYSPVTDTNPAIAISPVTTNPPPVEPPLAPPVTPPLPPVDLAVAAAGSEYVVVKGDTLGKIAKAHGVSLKALEAANPGVDSKKLKLKQKLTIPAGSKTASDVSPTAPAAADAGSQIYTVKSGDALAKIAKAHGTTVKAIQAANNLTTTKIKVGQKLKIPTKAEAAPAAPAPAPMPSAETTPPPALPPVSAPDTLPAR